jgi:hypothetical protein
MAGHPRAQELMQLRAQLEAFQQANGGARPDAPVKAEDGNPAPGSHPKSEPMSAAPPGPPGDAAAGGDAAGDEPRPRGRRPPQRPGATMPPPPPAHGRPSLDNLTSAASFDLANIFAA